MLFAAFAFTSSLVALIGILAFPAPSVVVPIEERHTNHWTIADDFPG